MNKKWIGAQGKTIHPTQAIDVRMGEEKQNQKQKEELKKERKKKIEIIQFKGWIRNKKCELLFLTVRYGRKI